MGPRPYDRAARDEDGVLSFLAELPAFAAIGRNYEAVEDAATHFRYDPAHVAAWRDFDAAIHDAADRVAAGALSWAEFDAEMARRFPDDYPRIRDNTPAWAARERHTPAGLAGYARWMATTVGLIFGSRNLFAEADDPEVEARRRRRDSERLERARAGRLPPGRYRVSCGDRAGPTPEQRALFDQLEADQSAIAAQVCDALRDLYRLQADQINRDDPQEFVLCPDAAPADAPLDRFRIRAFLLDADGDRIALTFETMFPHFEEHGCAAVVRAGRVVAAGGADVLFEEGWGEEG